MVSPIMGSGWGDSRCSVHSKSTNARSARRRCASGELSAPEPGRRAEKRPSTKHHPPVYVDRLSGNGAGLLGAEKQRGLGDFAGGLCASLQDGIKKARELFFLADMQFSRQL